MVPFIRAFFAVARAFISILAVITLFIPTLSVRVIGPVLAIIITVIFAVIKLLLRVIIKVELLCFIKVNSSIILNL
jgi:hypothetical protein